MDNKTIRLLTIEDNPGDYRLIQEMLNEAKGVKFEVQTANRFSAGIECLRKGNIDIVLLDLSLPDSEGLDTFKSVHAMVPEVPTVILTAIKDEALAAKAVQEGAQDYLIKGSIDGNLLVHSIRYAIERKKAEKIMQELQTKLAYANKMAAVGTLTGGVAHKINNPLTIILTNIQMLKEKLKQGVV